MEKTNLLIIGGFGFIGSNLLDRFHQDARYNLIVFEFSNLQPKAPAHQRMARIYYGDFNNSEDLESVFRENRIDIVIHLVCTTIPGSSNANIPFDIQSNLVQTVQLLELMRNYGVNRIVFLSSGGTVYGEPKSLPARESDPTDPICSYGIIKLSIEKYLHLFAHMHGLRYLILRPSNPYGPYHASAKQGLINVVLRRALSGGPVSIWGDGNIVRDYIYIGDLAEAVFRMVDGGKWGNVVNIGSGTGLSVREVLAAIGKVVPDLRVEYQPARNFDIERLVLDTARMRSLAAIPLTGLDEGISKTMAWLRSQAADPE